MISFMSGNSESEEAFCCHTQEKKKISITLQVLTRYFHAITTNMEYVLFYQYTTYLLGI